MLKTCIGSNTILLSMSLWLIGNNTYSDEIIGDGGKDQIDC